MKILFCGTQVPENIEYQIKDISAAGNRFQNNLIANLRKCGHEVTECVYIGVPVPENIRKELPGNIVLKSSGFLKSLLTYRKLVRKLLDDSDAVMCYNITYAWVFLPFWARKKKRRSIAVIADYSEAVSYGSVPGKLYAILQGFSMRHFDSIVGLSANIGKKLRKNQRFVLMEGGIDRELYDSFRYTEHVENSPITLLYSGLLSLVTGVDKLLEVMRNVKNQNIRLLISGKGGLEAQVRQAAQEDARILYMGHLPYEEYVKQLGKADILLNPRNMELPENQNNFPSKIMDYLAAGKIIISTKFAGWEKFSDYIAFYDTYEEIAEAIDRFMPEKQRETFDKNRVFAREFLWEEQVAKIVDR